MNPGTNRRWFGGKCLAKNSLGVIQGLQFAESENYPVCLCRVKTRIFFNRAETRRTFWARALSTRWTEYKCFVFQIKCPTFVILMVYRFTVFPVDICLWPYHSFIHSFINDHPVCIITTNVAWKCNQCSISIGDLYVNCIIWPGLWLPSLNKVRIIKYAWYLFCRQNATVPGARDAISIFFACPMPHQRPVFDRLMVDYHIRPQIRRAICCSGMESSKLTAWPKTLHWILKVRIISLRQWAWDVG